MVLMNGSKRARNASSISNQTNTCGGVGKSGLPPSVGRRGREGGRAARALPRPVAYACPASPGLYDKSLNAVNDGPVGNNRNSKFLYTKHIPNTVPDDKIFYLPVQANHLSGGVGKSGRVFGNTRLTTQ
jgi:hypothetical protein